MAGVARRGSAWPGTARHGSAGMARHGVAGLGMARHGKAGGAGLGRAGQGVARRGRHGGEQIAGITNLNEGVKTMAEVQLKQMNRQAVTVGIRGTSPLIAHAWSEKARKEMQDKQNLGKKTKARDVRDPEAECDAAKYKTSDGRDGISAMAFKKAVITAAHKDIGCEKTLVRKALFLRCDDEARVIPIDFDECVMRQDFVRVGNKSADLRYRPEYRGWRFTVTLEVDADLLLIEDLLRLIDRAGFGVGIGDWRPEKDGEFGRFCVDQSVDTIVEEL